MEKTLAKGLDLLEALVAMGEPASVTRLANMQGLYKSNVHRLLRTLAARGYVSQTESGLYLPTLRLTELGLAVSERGDLAGLAQPALSRIAAESASAAYLIVARRGGFSVAAAARPQEFRHQPLRVGDLVTSPEGVRAIADIHARASSRGTALPVAMIAVPEAAGQLSLCPLADLMVPNPLTLALWSPDTAAAARLSSQLPAMAEGLAAALGGNDAMAEPQDSETV